MKLPKLNWFVVAAVFALTAGILYVGNNAWHSRVIQTPLRQRLMQIDGVNSVNIERGRHGLRLFISAASEADFPLVARQVYSVLRQENSYSVDEIVWNDNPDAHLQAVREEINIVLQEARWRYRFVQLQESLEQLAQTEAISFQLGVDEGHVFLSLSDGTHAIQEAIPLLQTGGGDK